MNKYELTVVLNVKLEDEERAAAIEKVKGYITRFGGTVTNVDEVVVCFMRLLDLISKSLLTPFINVRDLSTETFN